MKKIIILLCFMMFMSVSAKHSKKNDKNPNATVLVKLNFLPKKDSFASKKTTGITHIDGKNLHKVILISYYDSVKIEPGEHSLVINFNYGNRNAHPELKYNFKPNTTYYIDVYSEKDSSFYAKIREEGETE
jgi:hypothetical protein